MTTSPDIVLVGSWVRDSLQFTAETQHVLSRRGKAYTIGLPPDAHRYQWPQRIALVDFDASLAPSFLTSRTTRYQ